MDIGIGTGISSGRGIGTCIGTRTYNSIDNGNAIGTVLVLVIESYCHLMYCTSAKTNTLNSTRRDSTSTNNDTDTDTSTITNSNIT
jgi:hypothetical protein